MKRLIRSIPVLIAAGLGVLWLGQLVPFLGGPPASARAAAQVSSFGGFNGGFGGFAGSFGCGGGFNGGFGGGFNGCAFSGGFNGGFGGFGAFTVVTPTADVEVGDPVPVLASWSVPSPSTWQDLRSVEIRIKDDDVVALWARWDQEGNRLDLLDARGNRVRPGGRLPLATLGSGSGNAGVIAGRASRVGTRLVSLDVRRSGVATSGEGGDSVALLLDLSFKRAAAGHTYTIEIRATDDTGEVLGFGSVGTLDVSG